MSVDSHKYERYLLSTGESRWADREEIINSPTIKRNDDEKNMGCGIPIISDGRTIYVDNSDTHTMILGSTGSKKTRLFGMPFINICAQAGESFIATDPKGELCEKTSGFVAAMGYKKIIIINLRDLHQSDFWNPLLHPYELYHSGKRDEAISMLNDFIHFLAEPQRRGAKDPYFIELGCCFFLALLLFFIETATPEEANISNFAGFYANYASPDGTTMLSEYMADGSVASVNIKGVLVNKDAKSTFGNIAACVSAMINQFVIRKALCQVMLRSSFDVRSIGKEKTAIYIIVPDEKTTLHFLVSAFIKQTYEILIREAQQQANNKLPVRVNFLLDEFCNIPTIPDMPTMISAARSRNMRFFMMVQGLFQLRQKYGPDAHTIIGNCDNLVFLTSREHELLMEISKLCGDTFFRDYDGNIKSHPLISVSELQRLKKEKGEALILHGRHYPFVTELPDIDDYVFKKYPTIEQDDRQLPQIVLYNADKVISEIKENIRPLPFSVEVFGQETFYNKEKDSKNKFLDW
jgi:type IV secretion system protein VirD4